MKHIIIEGGDRLGKSTLIETLAQHFEYDNVTVRHFGKPPKKFPQEITPFEFQKICFWKEGELLKHLNSMDKDALYSYYENVLIWNRAHLGEFVYGQMFRKTDPKEIKEYLQYYETDFLMDVEDTYLILLTADPDFFLEKEDGNSFSQNLEQKTKELKLFEEAFNESMLLNKIKIKVNQGSEFRPKTEIFKEILDFIS